MASRRAFAPPATGTPPGRADMQSRWKSSHTTTARRQKPSSSPAFRIFPVARTSLVAFLREPRLHFGLDLLLCFARHLLDEPLAQLLAKRLEFLLLLGI